MEAFPTGESTSETVKIYLFQIVARFKLAKTFLSDNGPQFVTGDLKECGGSLGIEKMESPSIIQDLMDLLEEQFRQ